MNRAEVIRLLESIRDHSVVALDIVSDPNVTERGRDLELAARCNYIDARLSALRSELLKPSTSGRPDSGLRAVDPEPLDAA